MSEKPWVIAKGLADDLPAIIRMRKSINAGEKTSFPAFIDITWEYEGGNSGMPDDAELELMKVFEDIIEKELEEKELCIHAVTFTYNDARRWICYIKDAEEFANAFNFALSTMPVLPIEMNFYDDPEWNAYNEFVLAAENLTPVQ